MNRNEDAILTGSPSRPDARRATTRCERPPVVPSLQPGSTARVPPGSPVRQSPPRVRWGNPPNRFDISSYRQSPEQGRSHSPRRRSRCCQKGHSRQGKAPAGPGRRFAPPCRSGSGPQWRSPRGPDPGGRIRKAVYVSSSTVIRVHPAGVADQKNVTGRP